MNNYSLEDIQVGHTESFTVLITDEMMDVFLQLSGDDNPLHISENYAREKGYPSRVVYGLLSSSFYSRLVGVHLPGQRCLLHGVNISFLNPAFVGDILTVFGEVMFVSDSTGQIEIKAQILNQKNEVISKAKIKCGIL